MTALEAVQLGAHQQCGVEFAPPTGIRVESILCTGDVARITNRDYVIAFPATPAVELLRVANRERIGPAIRAGMKRAFCDVSPEMDALLVTAPFGFPWPPGYQPPVTGVLCLTKVPYGPGKRRRSHTLICDGDGHYYLPPTTYYLLPTYLLPTTYYLLPTAYFLLPTTYYLLPTTCYSLLTTYYPLPSTYYLLPTTYYLLPATYLPTTYHLLPITYHIYSASLLLASTSHLYTSPLHLSTTFHYYLSPLLFTSQVTTTRELVRLMASIAG
jgi:hypothetical protein